jgi:hypothetical protein
VWTSVKRNELEGDILHLFGKQDEGMYFSNISFFPQNAE